MPEIDNSLRREYEEEDYDIRFLDPDPDPEENLVQSFVQGFAPQAEPELLQFTPPAVQDEALAQVAPSYLVFDERRKLIFWSIRPQDDCIDLARLFQSGMTLEDLLEKAARSGLIDTETVDLKTYVADWMARFSLGEASSQCRLAGERWLRFSDRKSDDGSTITTIVNVTSVERRDRAMAMLLGETQPGLKLFERAARALALGLGFQTASIARLVGDDEAETIACLHGGMAVDQRRFHIRGTPCEPVYRAGYFAFSGDFLRRFPLINFDGYLIDITHGSYVGQVIYDRGGKPIGHILAMDESERPFEEGDQRMVRMIAEHVAYELEHVALTEAAALREARFNDFSEAAHEAFFETDAGLACVFASPQAESVTGMTAQKWLGQPMSELGAGSDPAWQTCLRHINERRAFYGLKFSYGPSHTSARLSLSGKPLFDARGDFRGYRLAALRSAQDIVVAPGAVSDQSPINQVLGGSLEGIAMFSTDFKLIFCNEKFLSLLFGDRQDQIKPGMTLAKLSTLWLQDGADSERRQLMKFHLEPDALGSDYLDITTPAQHTLRVIRRRTEEGGLATIYLDITDLKNREQELSVARDAAVVANSTKSLFLANVSHELRTPLNAIIGFAEIMREQLLGPINNPRYYEYVHDIKASGEHLLDMINDILDLSKAEAGELELVFEAIDVAQIMNSVVRLMGDQAESGNLHFVALAPVDLPRIRGDQRRIKQVLINLISNAIKFTPAGGTIELSARAEDRFVKITVQDTGIGIAPNEMERVLIPFGQVDSEIARRHKGTGLGLPLAKKLVELHRGELIIDSQAGQGTRVAACFPLDPMFVDYFSGKS